MALGLLNPCLKITSCTILLLYSAGYASHIFFSLGAQGQGEENRWLGNPPGVAVQ